MDNFLRFCTYYPVKSPIFPFLRIKLRKIVDNPTANVKILSKNSLFWLWITPGPREKNLIFCAKPRTFSRFFPQTPVRKAEKRKLSTISPPGNNCKFSVKNTRRAESRRAFLALRRPQIHACAKHRQFFLPIRKSMSSSK